jgi:uncharacterized protein YuzE
MSRTLYPKKYPNISKGLPQTIVELESPYYNRECFIDPYEDVTITNTICGIYNLNNETQQNRYFKLSWELRGLHEGKSVNGNVKMKIDENLEVRALHIKYETSPTLAREIKQAFQQAILRLTERKVIMENDYLVKEYFRVVHATNSAIEFNDFVDAFYVIYDHLEYDEEQEWDGDQYPTWEEVIEPFTKMTTVSSSFTSRKLTLRTFTDLHNGLPKSIQEPYLSNYNRDFYIDLNSNESSKTLFRISNKNDISKQTRFFKLSGELGELHVGLSQNENVQVTLDKNLEIRGLNITNETSLTLAREIKQAIQQAVLDLTKRYAAVRSDYTVKEYFVMLNEVNSVPKFNDFVDAFYARYNHLEYDKEQTSDEGDHPTWEDVIKNIK